MSDRKQFKDTSYNQEAYLKLAHWLQQVLATPVQEKEQIPPPGETGDTTDLSFEKGYHLRFYQQLPDFVMALLQDDPQVTLHYAPLLYHLASCSDCHQAYLETYDAMHIALEPGVESRITVETRPLGPTPPRMLVHLSQVLISQAEALVRQARRDHIDNDSLARSLLQLAMKVSSQITQSEMRQRALHDLVRVATLFERADESMGPVPADQSYSPAPAGAGTRHGKVMRRADTSIRPTGHPPEQPTIYLQSGSHEGSITQHEGALELSLHGLKEALRGHFVIISVPLGSLIEPVRWVGGNPNAIRSTTPVDEQGALKMTLGHTNLSLSNPEERSLLEVMFIRLDVRAAS